MKKLEEELQCPGCCSTYNDPKLLHCSHSLCLPCLEQLASEELEDQDQQGQLSLACPFCHQVTPIPASGVADLQAAFHIDHPLKVYHYAAASQCEQIEELLNCPICLSTFTHPKILQCLHVYCRGCLGPLVKQDEQDMPYITCPNCRQVTPVLAGGVAGLSPAVLCSLAVELYKKLTERV